jgi:hypothetical protein
MLIPDSTDLDLPISILTAFQKGAYYWGIKVFNYLLPILKILSNELQHFILFYFILFYLRGHPVVLLN